MNARQRLPDQILHRDEVLAVGFAEVEHAADVAWVIREAMRASSRNIST